MIILIIKMVIIVAVSLEFNSLMWSQVDRHSTPTKIEIYLDSKMRALLLLGVFPEIAPSGTETLGWLTHDDDYYDNDGNSDSQENRESCQRDNDINFNLRGLVRVDLVRVVDSFPGFLVAFQPATSLSGCYLPSWMDS